MPKIDFSLYILILHNYISFHGHHENGLILNFTVGLKGNWKSNMIDTVCFELGMTLQALRAKNLKHLIHKSVVSHSNKNCNVEQEIYWRQLRTVFEKECNQSIYNNQGNQEKSEEIKRKLIQLKMIETKWKVKYKAKNFIISSKKISSLIWNFNLYGPAKQD